MQKTKISLDTLIAIVDNGGCVKTGIDIYNENDVLMLEKDVSVKNTKILMNIKKSGISELPVRKDDSGGIWDRTGKPIKLREVPGKPVKTETNFNLGSKIRQINEEKQQATLHYKSAQTAIKQILSDIQNTGGIFDQSIVDSTVTDLINYVTQNKNAVAYLINEILSYDSYLHNHSVNVCILSTAILKKFINNFEETQIDFMANDTEDFSKGLNSRPEKQSHNYLPQKRHEMAVAFFLHDVGKVLIDADVLKKKSPLSFEEFDLIKKHSYEKGLEVLQKNNLKNILAQNIVAYHHGPLYQGEEDCYPGDKTCGEIPPYVKICKLADIYDARTSKRCYKEAQNPSDVMADMFNNYVNKDRALQLMLHSFVNVVGICPPGSIVLLSNGQLTYVLDSKGPLLIPFTDTNGITLTKSMDPIDLGEQESFGKLTIDRKAPITFPIEVYNKLPTYLRASVQ